MSEDVESGLSRTEDLLLRARAGDERARCELAARHGEMLARFLHARLPPSARGMCETSDVVQQTLAAAFLKLERFECRGVGSFASYLRRIGLNMVAQEARRRGLVVDRSRALDGSAHAPASLAEGPPSALVSQERGATLAAALAQVPEPVRRALLLRLEVGLTYDEIARECSYASGNAARMAIGRALGRLAQQLSDLEP